MFEVDCENPFISKFKLASLKIKENSSLDLIINIITDRNVDMFLEDALDEMATDEFVNNDEVRMGDINEDNDDGDPFGDERDPDNDDDYN